MTAHAELKRRSAICRTCTEHVGTGCWKDQDYDCDRKRGNAEISFCKTGQCPKHLWDRKRIKTTELSHVACPACSFIDPLPDRRYREHYIRKASRELDALRQVHIDALKDVINRTYAPPTLHGDGVVISGEGKFWPGIVVACRLLRELGCRLPIQVWSFGDVGPELDGYDVQLIDMYKYQDLHPMRWGHPSQRGYQSKTYMLAHCGFRRVLYLDADAYCVQDPTPHFDLLDKAAFVYWQDLDWTVGSIHWEWTGFTNARGVPPIQGGQMLIDLQGWWRPMMIAHWMNSHSEYYYRHYFGDQDTWRVVLAATGASYCCLDLAVWSRAGRSFVCSVDGKPFIVHRVRAKLIGRDPHRCKKLPHEERVFQIYGDIVPYSSVDSTPFLDVLFSPPEVAKMPSPRQEIIRRFKAARKLA